jgi:hypothetical protein
MMIRPLICQLMSRLIFLFICLLVSIVKAQAAPLLQPITPDKIDLSVFVRQGAISGGRAQSESIGPLSLLQVQKVAASQNSERLTIKLGDKNGSALSEAGFFNVAIDEGGTRLILDLAQVQQTSVDKADLLAIIKQSSLIRDAEITMDPVDRSTNITFTMKRPVMAKASAQGNLVIDIQGAN